MATTEALFTFRFEVFGIVQGLFQLFLVNILFFIVMFFFIVAGVFFRKVDFNAQYSFITIEIKILYVIVEYPKASDSSGRPRLVPEHRSRICRR